jgi:hypothetical protein
MRVVLCFFLCEKKILRRAGVYEQSLSDTQTVTSTEGRKGYHTPVRRRALPLRYYAKEENKAE